MNELPTNYPTAAWIADPQRDQKLFELACVQACIGRCIQKDMHNAADMIRNLAAGVDRLTEMNRFLGQEIADASRRNDQSKPTLDDIFRACSLWYKAPIQEFIASTTNKDGQYILVIRQEKSGTGMERCLYTGKGNTTQIAMMDVICRIAAEAEAELTSVQNRLAEIRSFIEQRPRV